jgi:hypothetical protein
VQASHQLSAQRVPELAFRNHPFARGIRVAVVECLDRGVDRGEGREDCHAGVMTVLARQRQLHRFDGGLGRHPTDLADHHQLFDDVLERLLVEVVLAPEHPVREPPVLLQVAPDPTDGVEEAHAVPGGRSVTRTDP